MAKMNRKPPWRAKRIARGIRRSRLFPHRSAAADQQIRDLAQALRMPAPAIPSSPGAVGRRMRLGPEGRALLNRLLKSKTLREAQAWAKELAHQIRKRAKIHDRRRRIKRRISNRSRKTWQPVKRRAQAATRSAWRWARPRLAGAVRRTRDAAGRRWDRRQATRPGTRQPQAPRAPQPARGVPHYRPPQPARIPRQRRVRIPRPARTR